MSKFSNPAFHLFIRPMGLSLIIRIPLIFRDASANLGMKSSGNILWEVCLHGLKRTNAYFFKKRWSGKGDLNTIKRKSQKMKASRWLK